MKKLITLSLIVISMNVNAGFVHPMDFNGTNAQKNEVINYVKARVKHDYCDSGLDMCQNTTLRMMENENLKAFKAATKATNRSVMDRVIQDYCGDVDMCSYTNILMMYNENMKAGSTSLSW
jgi:hypothetical protein